MARVWTEEIDIEKHRDFMSTYKIGGEKITSEEARKIVKVYFLQVGSITLQFLTYSQILQMEEYLSKKVHSSTRKFNNGLEHYWQSWEERLPKGIHARKTKERVLKGIAKLKAIAEQD